MKILMVLTSHDELGDTGEKTGFWLEEFAAPYYALVDAGAEVVLASPDGGLPPIDPASREEEHQTESTRRLMDDEAAKEKLANTVMLAHLDPDDFDAVFFPGGHGPLWDLATNENTIRIIESMVESGRPIGAICHAPAVLAEVKKPDGGYFVSGKRVTAFTNSEEEAVGLTDTVPFLVESRLKQRGAQFRRADDQAAHVEVDGNLVTGQNPASASGTAEKFLELVRGAKRD